MTKYEKEMKELDEWASQFFGIKPKNNQIFTSSAKRKESFLKGKKKLKAMVELAGVPASVLKTWEYLAMFSIAHETDIISISNSGIAKYSNQSRGSVINALKFLKKHYIIWSDDCQGVKGKPRKMAIISFEKWFSYKNKNEHNEHNPNF